MRNEILVPAAIIFGGLIVAVAIFFIRSDSAPQTAGNAELVRPVSPEDHIIGKPDADVIIVEYSDIDCAYCKQFQTTMTELMKEYGENGNVAWVYRHFPLVNNHPNAAQHAEAAECVGSLAGETAFWRFIEAMQARAPGSNQFNPANYKDLLSDFGVSEADFSACRDGNQFVSRVESDFNNAIAMGAKGTPFTVFLVRGEKPTTLSGALPYQSMKQVIDQALAKVTQ
jgi:protein-disulfide isomerase